MHEGKILQRYAKNHDGGITWLHEKLDMSRSGVNYWFGLEKLDDNIKEKVAELYSTNVQNIWGSKVKAATEPATTPLNIDITTPTQIIININPELWNSAEPTAITGNALKKLRSARTQLLHQDIETVAAHSGIAANDLVQLEKGIVSKAAMWLYMQWLFDQGIDINTIFGNTPDVRIREGTYGNVNMSETNIKQKVKKTSQ